MCLTFGKLLNLSNLSPNQVGLPGKRFSYLCKVRIVRIKWDKVPEAPCPLPEDLQMLASLVMKLEGIIVNLGTWEILVPTCSSTGELVWMWGCGCWYLMASERQNEREPGGFSGRAWMCVFVHRDERQSKYVKERDQQSLSYSKIPTPLKKRSLVGHLWWSSD